MNFTKLSCIVLFLPALSVSAQVVSNFTWDVNPPTQAVTGPNATSIGSSATSSVGGVGGTNGLNPGLPKTDINMVIPNTGNVFDIANVDISIDYRRNEGTATLVKRNTFSMNANGISTLAVIYRVNDGTASGQTVASGNVYNIPSDNTFRNYRFTYDNCSGIGTLYVNNGSVWTSAATPNLPLYWNGEGNVVVGQDMDGSGNNIVNLDNFIWKSFTCVTLGIDLISFNVVNAGSRNHLTWSTATEVNNDFFTIERSADGMIWYDLLSLKGAGNSTTKKNYEADDMSLPRAINYYRLRQTDVSGISKTSGIISIDNSQTSGSAVIRVTDLMGREVSRDYEGFRFIYFSNGTVLKESGF